MLGAMRPNLRPPFLGLLGPGHLPMALPSMPAKTFVWDFPTHFAPPKKTPGELRQWIADAGRVVTPMTETPLMRMLQQIGRDAANVSDTASVGLLAELIAFVQQRQYAAMRTLCDQLQPAYRSRLGVLPSSHDEDVAMNSTLAEAVRRKQLQRL